MTPDEELAAIRASLASPEAAEWNDGERWGVTIGECDWEAEWWIEWESECRHARRKARRAKKDQSSL